MWPTILDIHSALADWPWLPALTVLARAATALIGLTIATHRAIRYWRTRRHH
jgi:hypothetical protein